MASLLCLTAAGCTSNDVSTSSDQTEWLTVTVFNVGKADAILLETEEGSVMIDTGLAENSSTLISQLEDLGVEDLYALILTHFDADHAGGASDILSSLTVENVYTTYAADDGVDITAALADAGLEDQVVDSSQDIIFALGDAEFTIEGAEGGYDSNEDNNSSLVTTVTNGTETLLFMGDAQKYRIEEYLAEHDETVDFLKVPYHGHYMNCLEDLFSVLQPAYSVISCSEDNPNPDEVAETAALLEEYGSVYYTYNGSVTVHCYADSISVSQ
ncbi:MAG: ComEC/Rec2 family competence protein [Oscillospiraceae bacterium]